MVTESELSEIFPRPAVREVACEIRFAPRLRVLPEVWRIQEKLAESHPQIIEERSPLAEGRFLQTYVFANKTAQSLIRVSQENFVVVSNSYTTFESFKSDAVARITDFCNEFDIKVFNRLGLRYVNHIDLDRSTGLKNLQQYLRAPIDVTRIDLDAVEQFVTEFRLKAGEHKLTVRGALIELQDRLLYILDLDCFDTMTRSASDLESILNTFHRYIQIEFLEHLTEEYKSIMRGQS